MSSHSNPLNFIYSVYYSFIAIFFKVASPWSVCRSWEDIWTACQKMSKQVSTDTNCFVRVHNQISELNLTFMLPISLCRRVQNVLSILGTVQTLDLPIVIILLFLLHYQTLIFKLSDIPLQLSLRLFYCTLFYYIFSLCILSQSGLI